MKSEKTFAQRAEEKERRDEGGKEDGNEEKEQR